MAALVAETLMAVLWSQYISQWIRLACGKYSLQCVSERELCYLLADRGT